MMVRAAVFTFILVAHASLAFAERVAEPVATPSISVIDVQVRDDKTNYLSSDQAVLDVIATTANADTLGTCAGGVAYDIDHPSKHILIDIIIDVNAGLHAKADLLHDANFGNAIDKPPADTACIAPFVTAWKFPKAGRFIVRIGIVPAMRSKIDDLPKGYVESLRAVCAAPSKKERDPAKQAQRIKDALAAHPSDQVSHLLQSMGGQWPSARPTIIRAAMSNAGLTSCALLDLK